MAERRTIGTVRVPSGALVVIDGGLLWMWSGEETPELPPGVQGVRGILDLHVTGRDVEDFWRAWGRNSYPTYIHDIPVEHVERVAEEARALARDKRLSVQVGIVASVPHQERLRQVLKWRASGGVATFHGIGVTVIGGVPTDRALPVVAEASAMAGHAGTWQRAWVELAPGEPVRTMLCGSVGVDMARLMVCDMNALTAWESVLSLDGLADLVLWGLHAAEVAEQVGAPLLSNTEHGWVDLDVHEAFEKAQALEALRNQGEHRFNFDFRPHNHQWQVLKQVRSSPTQSGTIAIDGAEATVFMTTWGDGVYDVFRDLAADGSTMRIRVELAPAGPSAAPT